MTAEPEVPADPVTVIRCHLAGGDPRVFLYAICRASLAARLIRDASGFADEVTDLGAGVLPAAEARAGWLGPGMVQRAGVAKDGRWLTWLLPGPPPPVPS